MCPAIQKIAAEPDVEKQIAARTSNHGKVRETTGALREQLSVMEMQAQRMSDISTFFGFKPKNFAWEDYNPMAPVPGAPGAGGPNNYQNILQPYFGNVGGPSAPGQTPSYWRQQAGGPLQRGILQLLALGEGEASVECGLSGTRRKPVARRRQQRLVQTLALGELRGRVERGLRDDPAGDSTPQARDERLGEWLAVGQRVRRAQRGADTSADAGHERRDHGGEADGVTHVRDAGLGRHLGRGRQVLAAQDASTSGIK